MAKASVALLLALAVAAGPAAASAAWAAPAPGTDTICDPADLRDPVGSASCAAVLVLCIVYSLLGGVCVA